MPEHDVARLARVVGRVVFLQEPLDLRDVLACGARNEEVPGVESRGSRFLTQILGP